MAGSKEVNRNIDKIAKKLVASSVALAQDWAETLEADMRENAPWHDRTSHARQGLKGTASFDGDEILIRLSHSVDYGVYLEFKHDGKYAILKPTGEANSARIYKTFKELWS
jgi:hypothetical protein